MMTREDTKDRDDSLGGGAPKLPYPGSNNGRAMVNERLHLVNTSSTPSVSLNPSSPPRPVSRLCDFADPDFPSPIPFNLPQYVRCRYTKENNIRALSKQDKDLIRFVDIPQCAKYLITNLKRVKEDCSLDDCFTAIVYRGIYRFHSWPLKEIYKEVWSTILNGDFEEPSDLHVIVSLGEYLKFNLKSSETVPLQKFRIPEELRLESSAIAADLGLKTSTLYQLFLADSLRVQSRTLKPDSLSMEAAIEEFTSKVLKQTRVCIAAAISLEISQKERLSDLQEKLNDINV